MTLSIECLVAPGDVPSRVEAATGDWVQLVHQDPDAVVRAIAGTGAGEAGILLDGRQLGGLTASQRFHAGLAVATCTLPPLPTMRVADVLLLGLRAPRPHLWQTIAGTKRAQTMSRDDEAHVRALAGRLGLAQWLDSPAVNLPPPAEALTDVTRALAATPLGFVLRSPDWLPATAQDDIECAINDEQVRGGFSVVEVVRVSRDGDMGA